MKTNSTRTRRRVDLALLAATTLCLSACGLLLGVPGDFSNCEGGPLDVDVPCGGGGTAPATSSTASAIGGASATTTTSATTETTSTTASGSGGAGGATAHCTDGTRDDGETDVDCGGACPPCTDGDGCETGADCSSKSCTHGTCATATCTDGIPNGGETDVDCGGPGTCPRCAVGSACTSDTDCDGAGPGRCTNGKCVATCGDGLMNGEETDVDCGGPCPGCAVGKACAASADCAGKACLGNQCGVADVSVGSFASACAVSLSGQVWCWGYNGEGQLGNGTMTDSLTPIRVSGLANATAVSVGDDFACALTSTGEVWCWGNGDDGELGSGTVLQSSIPVQVNGLGSGVRAVEAGQQFACAIGASGGLKCWGYNDFGQIGDGTTANRTTPTQVMGLTSGVVSVAAGVELACAVVNTGASSCWGRNYYGQLGNGTTTNSPHPVAVSPLTVTGGAAAASAGNGFACVVTAGGNANCWGLNTSGQLGSGNTTNSAVPVFTRVSNVAAISSGSHSSCTLSSLGAVTCWGGGGNGEMGNGMTTSLNATPVLSNISSGATQVSVGEQSACAVTAEGGVKCWGASPHGELGDGTTTSSATPVDVLFP
jgi:alpha-tubulin suppressor-like RCC1 family protein